MRMMRMMRCHCELNKIHHHRHHCCDRCRHHYSPFHHYHYHRKGNDNVQCSMIQGPSPSSCCCSPHVGFVFLLLLLLLLFQSSQSYQLLWHNLFQDAMRRNNFLCNVRHIQMPMLSHLLVFVVLLVVRLLLS